MQTALSYTTEQFVVIVLLARPVADCETEVNDTRSLCSDQVPQM